MRQQPPRASRVGCCLNRRPEIPRQKLPRQPSQPATHPRATNPRATSYFPCSYMESARTQRADLLDPATLASLGRIEIVARSIVAGFMTGLHRSARRGFSVEFADYRPDQPADDLRYLDSN